MRYRSVCTLGSVGIAVAFAALIAALEVSVAAIPVARGVDPASVNRILKGDRPDAVRATSTRQDASPALPTDCIAAIEWRRQRIYSVEVPGRCVG